MDFGHPGADTTAETALLVPGQVLGLLPALVWPDSSNVLKWSRLLWVLSSAMSTLPDTMLGSGVSRAKGSMREKCLSSFIQHQLSLYDLKSECLPSHKGALISCYRAHMLTWSYLQVPVQNTLFFWSSCLLRKHLLLRDTCLQSHFSEKKYCLKALVFSYAVQVQPESHGYVKVVVFKTSGPCCELSDGHLLMQSETLAVYLFSKQKSNNCRLPDTLLGLMILENGCSSLRSL